MTKRTLRRLLSKVPTSELKVLAREEGLPEPGNRPELLDELVGRFSPGEWRSITQVGPPKPVTHKGELTGEFLHHVELIGPSNVLPRLLDDAR